MKETTNSNLRELTTWEDEVSIVPFSGIQILDFGFDAEALNITHEYVEVPFSSNRIQPTDLGGGAGDNNFKLKSRQLIPLKSDPDTDDRSLSGFSEEEKVPYSIKVTHALEPFLGKWIPVPVLRVSKELDGRVGENFDRGPINWARMRIVELEPHVQKANDTHRIQLALDTSLSDDVSGDNYLSPVYDDSKNNHKFRFVSNPDMLAWFLSQSQENTPEESTDDFESWTSHWLKELVDEYFADNDRSHRPRNEAAVFEHWARYLSLLQVVDEVVDIPRLRMVDTVSKSDQEKFVDVELVLDIGNSRTCGIMVEQHHGTSDDQLSDSNKLGIRDLSRPELFYEDLVESRVEFADLSFGNDDISRASGRRNAFVWPSMVRIGPEAMRLIEGESGTETAAGLSSPKRYLWDSSPHPNTWRFHNSPDENIIPRGAKAAMYFLNESGDVINQVKQEENRGLREPGTSLERAYRPRFSNSSLYSFLLAEIISHVLVQINDPAVRAKQSNANKPRRLKKIILTMPTATPIQEQRIMRSRAESALKLIWAMLQENGYTAEDNEVPELTIEWDEASCTQVVFLYNEICKKFNGQIEKYLDLMGKKRELPEEYRDLIKGKRSASSLRVCSIDIGGGTTDMMMLTYHGEDNRRLVPIQDFREGFRIAGDDILLRIISQIFLKRLQEDIEERVGQEKSQMIASCIANLFGGDVGGMNAPEKRLRRQFALLVFTPLAITALELSEKAVEDSEIAITLADVFADANVQENNENSEIGSEELDPGTGFAVQRELVDYLESALRKIGVEDWYLKDWIIRFSRTEIDDAVQRVIQKALGNIVELIDHLDCDMVLLSGRPSRLPIVRSLIENSSVVRPDRIITMHNYRTDVWYPYRNTLTQEIGDPKSTVAVGGLLMSLAENRISNFAIDPESFQMKSTAKYIGEMEANNQILNDRLLFKEDDPSNQIAEIRMHSPVYIGSRQVPLERWTTTPLYKLDFANRDSIRGRTPVAVTLEREDADTDAETAEERLRAENQKENIKITEAMDKDEKQVDRNSDLSLSIHTLGREDHYWTESGVVARY